MRVSTEREREREFVCESEQRSKSVREARERGERLGHVYVGLDRGT